MTLHIKLHPKRFTEMSPFMTAIVGYILGYKYTNPTIISILAKEEEDLFYIQHEGDIGYNHLNNLTSLRDNWNRLLNIADLSKCEMMNAHYLFATKIGVPDSCEK
jgi:hypothetical protein